jgi:hypothetical protein
MEIISSNILQQRFLNTREVYQMLTSIHSLLKNNSIKINENFTHIPKSIY